MNHQREIDLLQECLQLSEKQSPRLAEQEQHSPIERYTDQQRFSRELRAIFRAHPIPLAHSSELPQDDSFVARPSPWGSVIISRSAQGVKAFHNVCRHRGAQLMDTEQGCARRFQCPYHAWTYNQQGELIAVPHGKTAFPELAREEYGLTSLHCEEAFGFVWVSATDQPLQPDFISQTFSQDLDWLDMRELQVFQHSRKTWKANWKLIAEGGLETYHFRTAHKTTIAPYFLDNVAVADFFGLHTRTILPFANLAELEEKPQADWSLRQYSHILYSLFPMNSLLVERDHIVWIQSRPLAADATGISISTLIPRATQGLDSKAREHWQKNHDITVTVLDEDFSLAENIQTGFASQANTTLRFGRNEGSLQLFNQKVERLLECYES